MLTPRHPRDKHACSPPRDVPCPRAKVFRVATYDELRSQTFPSMEKAFPHVYDKIKSELDVIQYALAKIEHRDVETRILDNM